MWLLGIMCTVAVYVMPAAGEVTVEVPAEEWGSTNIDGIVTFSGGTDGYITVNFEAQGAPPSPRAATVYVKNSNPLPVFTGDYTNVASVSLSIISDGHTPKGISMVMVPEGTDREWYNKSVNVSAVAGEVANTTVLFEMSTGWFCYWPGDPQTLWDADIGNVGLLGVRMGQGSLDEESYTVTNLVLHGVQVIRNGAIFQFK